MLQEKLDEISKIYPFKKFEYVYSDGRVKSVIIDIEDFLNLMETLEIETNPDLMQSIENGLKDFREGKLFREYEVFDEF